MGCSLSGEEDVHGGKSAHKGSENNKTSEGNEPVKLSKGYAGASSMNQ